MHMDKAEKLRQTVKEVRDQVNNDRLFTEAVFEQLESIRRPRKRGCCGFCFAAFRATFRACWTVFLLLCVLGIFMYSYRPAGDFFMKKFINNFHSISIPIRSQYLDYVLPFVGEWWGLFNTECLLSVPLSQECHCRYGKPKLKKSFGQDLNTREVYLLEGAINEDDVVDVTQLLEYSDIPPLICMESCSDNAVNCVDHLFMGSLIHDESSWAVTWQECPESTTSFRTLTPNLDSIFKEWSDQYLFTVSSQWGTAGLLKEMLEHNWVAIVILNGNVKLRVEPSLDCVMYCDTSLHVTLKPRDLFVFNTEQWSFGGQTFSDSHVVYYTTSFNQTNVLHTQ